MLLITLPRPTVAPAAKNRLHFGHYSEGTGRIAFASAAAARLRLACEPHQVLAHLCDVAAEGGEVAVEIRKDLHLLGRVGFPQLDQMVMPFWTPSGERLPDIGSGVARLHYQIDGTPFTFETLVRARWQGLLWQLQVPPGLDAIRVRLARRHRMRGWYLDFRSDGDSTAGYLSVAEVSTTGLLVHARPKEALPRPGHVFTGSLVGPAEIRVPVRVVVCRVVPLPDGRGILGCAFTQIGFQNTVRIANIVRLLNRQQGPGAQVSL